MSRADLSEPVRPWEASVGVCVCWVRVVVVVGFCVFTIGAGREVSLPPWPLGWHSGSPSLSH